jgi:hypothetical protein
VNICSYQNILVQYNFNARSLTSIGSINTSAPIITDNKYYPFLYVFEYETGQLFGYIFVDSSSSQIILKALFDIQGGMHINISGGVYIKNP